tara:strand:- start:23235 stop:23414 length:180 start_codon:yes stop_codon:yes gene_type:complete
MLRNERILKMEICLVILIMVNEKIYLVINESQPKNGMLVMTFFKSFLHHCILTTTKNNI